MSLEVSFSMSARIARPAGQVFAAVIDPRQLERYFVTSASGPLAPGASVEWLWQLEQGEDRVRVVVQELEPDARLRLRWEAFSVHYWTDVTIRFEPLGADETRVTIEERGWKDDQAGLDSAFEHCSGWQHMLICLKAWLVHGIDLR